MPPPAPAAVQEDVETIKASNDAEDRLTVPVSIAGEGPFHFLIDTGSQRTIVSTALADELSLAPGPTARVVTISGVNIARTAILSEFRLGKRTYDKTLVPLFERQNIGADGIIGTDTLQGQRVLLDFTSGTIQIGSRKSLGGDRGYEIIVSAKRKAGQIVMTDAELDGIPLTVIIDTGAGLSIGNRALQRAMARRSQGADPIRITDITGADVLADLGIAKKLSVDRIDIGNFVIAYADTPAFAALDLDKRPALFLGMHELRLFERVAIDFAKAKVYFDLPRQ